MAGEEAAQRLLDQIADKRLEVRRYVAAARPRRQRLQNVSILGGGLSTAFTAGPAVGGKAFTAWLGHALGLGRPAWQLLCGAAAVCSILATAATQMLKARNIDEHVARAQGCSAKLEALEVGLGTGQLDVPRAASEYIRCVEEVAFLHA
jgi:hypothetical protein